MHGHAPVPEYRCAIQVLLRAFLAGGERTQWTHLGGAEIWDNITDVDIEELELALGLRSRKKACIPGRKLPADDGGLGTQYGWGDAMEIWSRKQLLLFFPLAFHCPSKNSLGTKPEQKPPGAPSQRKKKKGARSKMQEVSTQRKKTAIAHPTLLCHAVSWGVTQASGYTFHGSSYPQKILLKSSLCAGPSGTGYNPSYL